jgi:predicted nucleotidyltransferase
MPRSVLQYRDVLRRHVAGLAAKYKIASLGLFGSRVRGDERSDSDLDILVSFHEAPTLLRFIELEQELTELVGVKVDLVMREALKPQVGEHVLREVVAV